jgi:hypothetical protein
MVGMDRIISNCCDGLVFGLAFADWWGGSIDPLC